jgi:hypothetical protein
MYTRFHIILELERWEYFWIKSDKLELGLIGWCLMLIEFRGSIRK